MRRKTRAVVFATLVGAACGDGGFDHPALATGPASYVVPFGPCQDGVTQDFSGEVPTAEPDERLAGWGVSWEEVRPASDSLAGLRLEGDLPADVLTEPMEATWGEALDLTVDFDDPNGPLNDFWFCGTGEVSADFRAELRTAEGEVVGPGTLEATMVLDAQGRVAFVGWVLEVPGARPDADPLAPTRRLSVVHAPGWDGFSDLGAEAVGPAWWVASVGVDRVGDAAVVFSGEDVER